MSKLFSISALLLFVFITTATVQAAEHDTPKIERQGNMYVLKLPGLYRFHEVLEILKVNLFDHDWVVRDVHDVDIAMRTYGKLIHNKVLRISKPDYLKDAIEENQMNALTLTQSIVIYQEFKGVSPLSYGSKPGEIVIGFLDPVEMTKFVKLGKQPHSEDILKELQDAVNKTAVFFTTTEAYTLPKKP